MDSKSQYEQLHAEILSEIRKNGACVPGYKSVLTSESIKEISNSIKRWWNEVLGMHLESSLHLFSEFFSAFAKEFNANGIYFNQDTSDGYAIIYNSKVRLSGNAQGRSFGESEVEVCERASLLAFNQTKVNARDQSKVTLKNQCRLIMYDQSEVNAYDDSSVVCQGGKTLHLADKSCAEANHCGSIYAYGESRIKSDNPRMTRRIYLHEQSSMK